MDQATYLTRLAQAIKGISRFANPKARVAVSGATTRDAIGAIGLGIAGQVTGHTTADGQANGIFSLTDMSGNLYAMTDIPGACSGSTIY